MSPERLLEFWFGQGDLSDAKYADSRMKVWFAKDNAFDAKIREEFAPLLEQFDNGELETWKETPRGHLALVVLLDQVPRNAFRDKPEMFAHDAAALDVAKEALDKGLHDQLEIAEAMFLLLPFEHAEDISDQEEGVRLFADLVERAPAEMKPLATDAHRYAIRHRDIIARFGRFPHRNKTLGRTSTAEEVEFLKQPGSGF